MVEVKKLSAQMNASKTRRTEMNNVEVLTIEIDDSSEDEMSSLIQEV